MEGGHKLSNTKITKICAELEQTGEYIPVGRHMTKGCKGNGDWSEESNMIVRFKLTDLQSVQGVIASTVNVMAIGEKVDERWHKVSLDKQTRVWEYYFIRF